MNIKIERLTDWKNVLNSARTTINKSELDKDPSDNFKESIIRAEHSPIRQLIFKWKWEGIKSWISVHFVRHKIGIEHFVSTQRTDRTGVDRDNSLQSTLVNHECIANAQAIINISRKRLCHQSSIETRQVWQDTLVKLKEIEPLLNKYCVPECIYRGFCPEISCCGMYKTQSFKDFRELYIRR